jgi:hypothetical protein
MTLPSGIGIMKQSDNSIVAFSTLSSTPTPIYLIDTNDSNAKIVALSLAKVTGGSTCGLSNLVIDTNNSTYAAVMHDTDDALGIDADHRYNLLIPKSASHNQVRVCSGKTTIGCTSANSWSFLANAAGSITVINGGFSTTGITVAVSGGYWVIKGLTGTSGQGESSGGGGGDVPEFSTIGLLILLGGCYMMARKNGLIEG